MTVRKDDVRAASVGGVREAPVAFTDLASALVGRCLDAA